MDLFVKFLDGVEDLFVYTLQQKIVMSIKSDSQHCQWEPFGEKFKCSVCGFISPRSTIKRNCKQKENTPPNLIQKAVNFTKAATQHVMSGLQHCPEEEKKRRFEICSSNECGYFVKNGEDGVCSHSKCGCPIRNNGKIMDKLSWANSYCPIHKWGPVQQKKRIKYSKWSIIY